MKDWLPFKVLLLEKNQINVFDRTKLTITRNLRKDLGELDYKELLSKNKKINDDNKSNQDKNFQIKTQLIYP